MRQDRQVGRSIHHTADQKVHMYGRLLASRAQYGPGNVQDRLYTDIGISQHGFSLKTLYLKILTLMAIDRSIYICEEEQSLVVRQAQL